MGIWSANQERWIWTRLARSYSCGTSRRMPYHRRSRIIRNRKGRDDWAWGTEIVVSRPISGKPTLLDGTSVGSVVLDGQAQTDFFPNSKSHSSHSRLPSLPAVSNLLDWISVCSCSRKQESDLESSLAWSPSFPPSLPPPLPPRCPHIYIQTCQNVHSMPTTPARQTLLFLFFVLFAIPWMNKT